MKITEFKEAGAHRHVPGKANFSRASRLYDVRNFHISLKQWRMLHAVVECNGFMGAADKLHLSQSAISYTIAKLQDQLGIPLLKIQGRKAQITEAGKILLDRSRNLIREALELEELAENLRNGWGSEIRLATDHNYPSHLLMLALKKFSDLFHNIKVILHEASPSQVEKALLDHVADLAISTHIPAGFIGNPLIEIEHVAVAHPQHPLFKLQRELMATDIERQVQIVISQQKETTPCAGKQGARGYFRPWNVYSFDAAIDALRECLGYAWLPHHRLKNWLDRGDLRILPFGERNAYRTNLYLIYGHPLRQDSGAKKLADMLRQLSAMESSASFNASR